MKSKKVQKNIFNLKAADKYNILPRPENNILITKIV